MGTATYRHASEQGSRCQRPPLQGPQGPTHPPPARAAGPGGRGSLPGLGHQALTTVFTARYIRAPKVWASLPRTSWSSPKRSKVTTGLQQNPAMVPARRSGLAPRLPGPQRDPRPGGPSSPPHPTCCPEPQGGGSGQVPRHSAGPLGQAWPGAGSRDGEVRGGGCVETPGRLWPSPAMSPASVTDILTLYRHLRYEQPQPRS